MSRQIKRPFDELIEALRDPNPLLQADAARLLGDLADPRAVDPLVEYVTHSRYNTKTAGIEALRRIGEPRATAAIRPLVDAPNVQDDWYWYARRSVRAAAALLLLHWNDRTGLPFLESLADSGNLVFHTWYAPSVLRLPDQPPSAVQLKSRLTPATLLGEEGPAASPTDPAQVVMVAEALEVLGDAESCVRLIKLLEHRSRYVRGRSATALLAVAPVEDHIDRVTRCFKTDPTDFARVKAALALARTGHSEGARFLADAGGSLADSFDRAVAIEALGELGRPEHADVARSGLTHADSYVRLVSLEALARMDAREAGNTAVRMLEDPSPRVRLQAAAQLASQSGINGS